MVSGNKAQLVERILKHADGSVARTFDEDIEDDDENMPSSSHDDTSSDSEEELTEYEGGSSGDDYVERSFQVLFILLNFRTPLQIIIAQSLTCQRPHILITCKK